MHRLACVLALLLVAGCTEEEDRPAPQPVNALTVALGPENPAGGAVAAPATLAVLQIALTAGPSEGVDITSVTFTDVGNGNTSKIRWAALLLDSGTTAGAFDPGDVYIDPTTRAFSGQAVTFALDSPRTIAAGATETSTRACAW